MIDLPRPLAFILPCLVCFAGGLWTGRAFNKLNAGVSSDDRILLNHAAPLDYRAYPSQSPAPPPILASDCENYLQSLPNSKLSELAQAKFDRFQREVIEKRFPPASSETEKALQTADLLSIFEGTPSAGSSWDASAQVGSGGSEGKLEILFTVAIQTTGDAPLEVSGPVPSLSSVPGEAPMKGLIWTVEGWFKHSGTDADEGAMGRSGTADSLGMRAGHYFAVTPFPGMAGTDGYESLAVSVPGPEGGDGMIELLDARTEKWVEADQSIRWERVSAEEAKRIRAR